MNLLFWPQRVCVKPIHSLQILTKCKLGIQIFFSYEEYVIESVGQNSVCYKINHNVPIGTCCLINCCLKLLGTTGALYLESENMKLLLCPLVSNFTSLAVEMGGALPSQWRSEIWNHLLSPNTSTVKGLKRTITS